jgi:hypothetical protein
VSGPSPMRSFDPRRVGGFECRAWVTYYRREWPAMLAASVGLVHAGFRMSWGRTLRGAWLVLRANQLWAPPVDNDPDGARRCMERFYRLVAEDSGETLDTVEAARLEVDWWRAHRVAQHGPAVNGAADGHTELVEALVRLYAFVYRTDPAEVATAAALRAEAMDVSDRWVAEGCDLASPLVDEERALLVRSYASLLSAVHRSSP